MQLYYHNAFNYLQRGLDPLGLIVKQHSETHWQVFKGFVPIIDVWPTSGKYRERKADRWSRHKSSQGDADDVIKLAHRLVGDGGSGAAVPA